LSVNAKNTQREILKYEIRKFALNALKKLKIIPNRRNDTTYSNSIRRGTLVNTE